MTLGVGQRVQHARYGIGVTTVCTDSRTTIQFDEHGAKTFVTSMLEIQVLSEPGAWLVARGKPRPKRTGTD